MSQKRTLIILALVSVALAAFVSPFASTFPDGLERVAEKLGFVDRGSTVLASPAPDYSMPGVTDERLSGSVAGVLGAGIVFLCAYLVGTALSAARGGKVRGGS